jgi:hypothetical protein
MRSIMAQKEERWGKMSFLIVSGNMQYPHLGTGGANRENNPTSFGSCFFERGVMPCD